MSFVDRNLLINEQVVYRAKLHWIIYVIPVAVLTIAVVLLLGGAASRMGFWPGLIVGLIGIVMIIPPWIRGATSEFAITNRRVLIKIGVIRRHSLELLLGKIEGIGVDQGISGRIFGFGTVTVSGVGSMKEPFRQIAHPLEFRRQIQSRIDS